MAEAADEPLLVLGAGLAGSAVALVLAQGGRSPCLIDRDRQAAEKVCGCFLSVETVSMLTKLGVDPDGLGASHITRVRLIHHRRMAEARLPFGARGLSRRALDEALLAKAAQAGARLALGVAATAVAPEPGSAIEVALRGGCRVRAGTLFLATGKHDVRGAGRDAGEPAGNIGFKQMFRLSPRQVDALRDAVELYLFDGGYAGLQLVENGAANLCLILAQDAYRARGGEWERLLAALSAEMPLLANRLGEATALIDRPLAVSHIPYGFVHQADERSGGMYRLGDQAAVIPSFSGDGMAIALYSGIAAARTYLAGGSADDYHGTMRRVLGRQFRLAGWLNRMAASGMGRGAMVTAGGLSPALMRWAAQGTRLRV